MRRGRAVSIPLNVQSVCGSVGVWVCVRRGGHYCVYCVKERKYVMLKKENEMTA